MRSTATTFWSSDGASVIHLVPHTPLEGEVRDLAMAAETPAISDVCSEPVLLDPAIVTLTPGQKLVGLALTVELPPGDNLLLHIAIRLLQSGDILVVSAGGLASWTAPFGDMMSTSAAAMGAAGAVIDGFVRDRVALASGRLPVFARGVSPQACNKRGSGTINAAVRCGGTIVRPGDVLIGDDTGIVAVARGTAREILKAAMKKSEAEASRKTAIAHGAISPSFLDGKIRELGLQALLDEPEWLRGERVRA